MEIFAFYKKTVLGTFCGFTQKILHFKNAHIKVEKNYTIYLSKKLL